ncbi:SMI1/KNR4 family protein [Paenibacillus sp. WLX2291]|uniref:SMI1/KNR4 family protein n=1 Tax=Paenibacillus sp. WLX2291 TaxID=3296934 RepID=UPI003983F077
MIGTWMEEIKSILRTELSSLEDFLLPPAGDVEIAQVEQAMNITFPDEWKQLYHTHNGESRSGPGLFFGLQFLSLNEMLSEWKIWSDLESDYQELGDHYSIPSGWVKEQYINRKWIPFCHDGGGNHLGIDLDPDENGVVGQVINFGRDEETKFVIAHNLGEFIHFMRNTVREGNYTVEQEDGMGYWMYGRNDQARLLRDAQQFALGDVVSSTSVPASATEFADWMGRLSLPWQDLIRMENAAPEDFERQYRIYLTDENLTDVSGLERCKEVRELSLSRNQVTDIQPLVHCRELKNLYLIKNPISDLRPLSRLPYLYYLNISGTAVSDLSPLAELPRLTQLDCSDTPVEDYRPLTGIATLTDLTISSPSHETAQIISSMRQLRHLTVNEAYAWRLQDWQQIATLPLTSLKVNGAAWNDVEHLRALDQLQELSLQNVRLDDASALAHMPSLQKLSLLQNTDVGELVNITSSPTLRSFLGSFVQFDQVKDGFVQNVDFSSLIGDVTDEQREVWSNYNRR